MKFTVYESATGRVLFGGECQHPASLAAEGQILLTGVRYEGGWVGGDGKHHEQPCTTNNNLSFNWTTKLWEDLRLRVEIVEAQWEKIKALRDSRTESGGWLAQGKWFHSDAKSISQQLGLARKADLAEAKGLDMNAGFPGEGPEGLYWKTMDGSFVLMTPSLAHAIFDSSEVTQRLVFSKAEHHRAAMQASASPEEYTYTTGWPLTYGET